MEKWSTDIIEWNKLSESAAQLYITLAENRLDETVETAKNITDRNDKLLALNITIITAILGYLASKGLERILNGYLCISLSIMMLILILSLVYLVKNLFLYKIGTKGEEPRFILNTRFVDDYPDNEQYLNLALQVCETYQNKITSNITINNRRNRRLSWAIYIMLSLPLSFLISFAYWYLVQ
jgi:hypothetical protein